MKRVRILVGGVVLVLAMLGANVPAHHSLADAGLCRACDEAPSGVQVTPLSSYFSFWH